MWSFFFPPFLHFQIFQRLAWGGATIVALIVITSSSLSETSEPLQPRSHFLLAFLKLLRLARGGRCICLLITDWPKGVPASLAGDEMFILMRTQTGVATTKHTHTLPLTHTGTLSFFFSLDFYPSLCRSNTRLKITLFLALTLGHAHTHKLTHTAQLSGYVGQQLGDRQLIHFEWHMDIYSLRVCVCVSDSRWWVLT